MKAKVFFKEIRDAIVNHINAAQKEIRVAVAWFTDEDIMRALIQAQAKGIRVHVAISDCKENFINIRKLKGLINAGIALYVSSGKLLHHKFCIIDDSTIVNGSYNWSYQAQFNDENIVAISLDKGLRDDELMLLKFNAHFNYLCSKTSRHITDPNMLNVYRVESSNSIVTLASIDEREIELRAEFENDVRASFEKSITAKIPIGNFLEERMVSDGGGVEFVKRILRDEMGSGDMKSGFKRLEQVIPHRVDLSLEYLVSRKKYQTLFSATEVYFCVSLMKKYRLEE